MKTLCLIAFLLIANIHYAQDRFEVIYGTLVDKDQEPHIDMIVVASSKDANFFTRTDLDGRFRFNNLPTGIYTLKFILYSDTTYFKSTINIEEKFGTIYFVNETVKFQEITLCGCPPIGIRYFPPDNSFLASDEINESVNQFAPLELTEGIDSRITGNSIGELSFHGAQQGDYLQFIDGVKSRNLHAVPGSAMKSNLIYSGFIPAKYGDTNGGIVITETLGYFDLLRQWENSK